jgi:glycosyltransferase involved in cell wall biosynthesis
VRVADAAEARCLLHGAGAALLPRGASGGFPVKLLNYLEARRAVALRAGLAEGLVHRRSAWLVADEAGPEGWAAAIAGLLAHPDEAARLGAAGRRHLERAHDPAALAARTLALLGAVADQRTC